MSITFEQLLTDPKYSEMSVEQLEELLSYSVIDWRIISKLDKMFGTKDKSLYQTSIALATHLQKLKAESEKKAEDIKVIDRYPMCKDQPAQIDCRRADCIYQNKGQCSNISPAITLNDKSTFVCWSYKDAKGEAEPNYGESPIISHINAIQMGALIEKVAKEFNKPVRFEVLTKPEHPIQITDQKAREICAKYFNCPPNEIKIV